jgi:hypothetical protein
MTPFFFIFLLIFPMTLFASAAGPTCWKVTGVAADDMLNIRSAPNAQSRILGKIPSSASGVPNVNEAATDAAAGLHPGWCRIKYQDITGYVNCRYLQGSEDCAL